MSLHAELSPEAQARLDAQRRNSTISSLLIAVLTLILIGGVLALFTLKIATFSPPAIIAYTAENPAENDITRPTLQQTVQRKPARPSASNSRVIAAVTSSDVAVPIPDTLEEDPATDFGDGEDFGLGFGEDEADGEGSSGLIPTALRRRCSLDDRLNRLKESGGTRECETAVVKALQYLKSTQQKDGSWNDQGQGGKYPVGQTSMALLAFLGHCETPASAQFGQTVEDAIVYLVNVGAKRKGRLASDLKNRHYPYEHAIAVYALSEAYSLCQGFNITVPGLEDAIKKGGDLILESQHKNSGGWDYSYDVTGNRGGDSSIAGWHVQAVKAMGHTGIQFRGLPRAEREALDYFKSLQERNGAIGYRKGQVHGDGTTLAAVGALCYQILGKGNNSVARKAIQLINKDMVADYNNPAYDLYGHYYAAQVLINEGGKAWEKFNNASRDNLLKAQREDGSFGLPFGGRPMKPGASIAAYWNNNAGTHYRTCLATLTLEVYYRFLPSALK